jgi:hypothetical protein
LQTRCPVHARCPPQHPRCMFPNLHHKARGEAYRLWYQLSLHLCKVSVLLTWRVVPPTNSFPCSALLRWVARGHRPLSSISYCKVLSSLTLSPLLAMLRPQSRPRGYSSSMFGSPHNIPADECSTSAVLLPLPGFSPTSLTRYVITRLQRGYDRDLPLTDSRTTLTPGQKGCLKTASQRS